MGGFLYFVPADVTRPAELSAYGLDYAFERGMSIAFCPCRNGPGGVAGTVVGCDRGGMIVGYYPSKQTWRKIPGPGDVHAGCYQDARPGPAQLLRRDALDGYPVRMLDGNDWLVPTARGLIEQDGDIRYQARLPAAMALDEDGQWKPTGVTQKYAALWSVAERFWDAFTGANLIKTAEGGRAELMLHDLADGVITALATNYRLGPTEAAMLELLDQECCREALKAVIDWPVMESWLEKKTRESLTADG